MASRTAPVRSTASSERLRTPRPSLPPHGALGAYAVYFISPESESANALVALVAGAALGAVGALVIGVFAMLTRGFYFIMVTLAAGQMVFSIFYDTNIAKG